MRYGGRISIKDFDSDPVVQKVVNGKAVLISNVEILNDVARAHCAEAPFYLAKEGFLSVFVTMMIRRALPFEFKQEIDLRYYILSLVSTIARKASIPLTDPTKKS